VFQQQSLSLMAHIIAALPPAPLIPPTPVLANGHLNELRPAVPPDIAGIDSGCISNWTEFSRVVAQAQVTDGSSTHAECRQLVDFTDTLRFLRGAVSYFLQI
jgi:hypothetical protein